ncbi:hypothetical protein EDD36DRAFT_277223 [Exophiala viscosa]|uniref:MYND-type domain-containing protein n=1 Tax=Exophiala viscosa TaxID=2486360 RepID=A0AAN6DVD5_9EURO|nr:hypothetical protein EDD36DRAFT_277223 [Exophiala viscosa]
MAVPARIEPVTYFYATGNTPAVNLAQSLPPEKDGTCLLLGCGDVRNVLFTAYSRLPSGIGRLDITCCDILAETIARNALLYTLLIDDKEDNNAHLIWNIYYHTMVDQNALQLLRDQAKKLSGLTTSLETWHNSPYGNSIRFCDQGTFTRVIQLWKFYSLDPSHGPVFHSQQKRLQASFSKAQNLHTKLVGGKVNYSAVRSTAPCTMLAMEDRTLLSTEHWKTGLVLDNKKLVKASKYLNPMFGAIQETVTLHYATDPLLGFHLAPAFVSLAEGSPLRTEISEQSSARAVASAAFAEFQAWTKSFRRAQFVIRFVASDALAFCYVLQHHRIHQETQSANWYCDRTHYEQLVLDSEDYTPGGHAPTVFDIIDTSNLIDHLGPLNVLVAGVPLLHQSPYSALYTEILVLRDTSVAAYVETLLCGDLATVSAVLGISPCQYWTNTTTISSLMEILKDGFMKEIHKEPLTQSRLILMWKAGVLPVIKFDSDELARLMYRVYLQMFRDESWANMLSTSAAQLTRTQYAPYTRASIVELLKLVKSGKLVDFDKFIKAFCDNVAHDTVLNMGAHYIQELFMHLHMSGLFSASTYEPGLDGFMDLVNDSPLRTWKDLPATLCLTLVVPHSKLWLFQKKSPTDTGSPLCHVALQHTDGRQNFFPDLQLGFGKVRTTGVKHTGDFTVYVDSDEKEWQGKGPLIVSVVIPTWLALYDLDHSTKVAFALKSTPMTVAFTADLGMMLELHKSSLASDDVYLTTNPPNMAGRPPLPCDSKTAASQGITQAFGALAVGIHPTDQTTTVTFTASLENQATKVEKLNVHLDIVSPKARSLLRSKGTVNVQQMSPFRLRFNIGLNGFQQDVRLPMPFSMSGGKTRVARTSAYLEFIGTVASPTETMSRTDGMTPLSLTEGKPLLETLPYVSLDSLPILDIQKTENITKHNWMGMYLITMFSARERAERDRCQKMNITPDDGRISFKDSLFGMFMVSTGAARGSPKQDVFALCLKGVPAMQYLICVSSIRIDISSHSIVLDAALLPITKQNEHATANFLGARLQSNLQAIEIDENELAVWQHVLPAFAERCRDWQHRHFCEYDKAEASVPLSTERGEDALCSCGRGKFPKGYNQHILGWDKITQHCTRIAITPLFPVPFVEKVLDLAAITDKNQEPSEEEFDETTMANMLNGKKGCWNCGKEGVKLLKCGKCMVAEYCSKDCQRSAWKEKGHKQACQQITEFKHRQEEAGAR